jgi:hypothetical protein
VAKAYPPMSRASWTRADLPTASGAAALWRVATLSGQRGGGIPIGVVRRAEGFAPWFAPPEHSVLVLGPPRSGKTSAIVIPAVIAAPGPVVSTSTKRDVLDATAPARSNVGPCLLYDPLGGIEPPAGVEPVGWTPLHGCDDLIAPGHARVCSGSQRRARRLDDRGSPQPRIDTGSSAQRRCWPRCSMPPRSMARAHARS